MHSAPRWVALACAALLIIATHARARAHDLAIDQLVLWPDRASGTLRGEITFDPELTRPRDTVPGAADAQRVRSFLSDQVRLEVDGSALRLDFEIRELWVGGGAVPGDVVQFTTPLPRDAALLRAFAGAGFKALVVSIQNPLPSGHAEAWSWLLRGGEWTPRYPLGSPSVASDAAWRRGGPELFAASELANHRNNPPESAAPESAPPQIATPPAAPGMGTLALRFVGLGFEHILPHGVDHLLFVAGLVLGAARNTRRILLALTSFTLAHTLTLALSQSRWLHAPPEIVEPIIALSICLVGVDNLRASHDTPRHWRRRHAVVFAFGLVHGLGFGRALAEMSFGGEQLLVALLSFNLGVELGQITFVLLLLAGLYWIKDPLTSRRLVVVPGSWAIIIAGLVFAAQRVLG